MFEVFTIFVDTQISASSTKLRELPREPAGGAPNHALVAADGAYRERVHGHVPAAGSAGAGS